jgi:hypothetical protein
VTANLPIRNLADAIAVAGLTQLVQAKGVVHSEHTIRRDGEGCRLHASADRVSKYTAKREGER